MRRLERSELLARLAKSRRRHSRRAGVSVLVTLGMIVTSVSLAQSAQAAAPPVPATDTQCDWLDDMTGTPTPVTFDVREFAGSDLAPIPTVTGNFTYMVNLDNTGDPFNPDPIMRPGDLPMASDSPIVESGTISDGSGVETVTLAAGCRYLINVRADGYNVGGAHIRIEADGTIIGGPGIEVDGDHDIQVVLVSDQVGYVNGFHDAALVDARSNTGEAGLQRLLVDPAQRAFANNGPPAAPGRIFGVVPNDLIVETDPDNIRFEDNAGAANVPVGIYDATGRLITTVWTSESGWFEVLLPSTAGADAPIPGGVGPSIYLLVANDAGPDAEPNFGYDPQSFSEPFPKDVWPGKTTKVDMSTTPLGLGVCNVVQETPQLMAISDVTGVAGIAQDVTIFGTGFEIGASPPNVTITDELGNVTVLSIVSFTPSVLPVTPEDVVLPATPEDVVVATVPALRAGMYQIDVSSNGDDSPRNGISFHVIGAGYAPPIVEVFPPATVGAPAIQAAIDAAVPGSLIVVHPGNYQESIIVHNEVKLQGFGPGGEVGAPSSRISDGIDGTIISPRFGPADIQAAWQSTVAGIGAFGPNTNVSGGAGFSLLLDTSEANGADGFALQIDGFGITNGRGANGGGIWANGNASGSIFSNNVMLFNSASRGGGAITLGVHSSIHSELANDVNNNADVVIRNNRILGNGGVFSAGGIGIFNDSDGYLVTDNAICGNYSAEYGGGVSHFGLSPGGAIVDNAIYYNGAFEEGGGILVGGESTAITLGAGSGDVVIERNIIQSNMSSGDGGGIMLLNPLNDAIDITNNMIVNNAVTGVGGGIALGNADNVRIVNNTIAENLTTSTVEDADFTGCAGTSSCPRAAGLTSSPYATGWTALSGDTYSNPEMYNNIFWQNRSYVWNTVIDDEMNLEFSGFIDMEVVDAVPAQPDGPNLLNPMNSMLTVDYPDIGLTDPSNTVGVDPLFVATSSITPAAIAATGGGRALVTVDLQMPGASILGLTDYSLTAASPAIDPVTFGVPFPADDLDGDVRDANPDIGADESTASNVLLYFTTVGNVAGFRDEDIIAWDGTSLSMFLDLSAAGVVDDLKAFKVIDEDTFLLSFGRNAGVSLPNTALVAQDEDVVLYDAGVWSIVFDGSLYGLGQTNAEDIDGLDLTSDGDLLISTVGNVDVPGITITRRDEDVLRFEPIGDILEGQVTGGSWFTQFDGSDVGLQSPGNADDLDAIAETTTGLLFSTNGSSSPTGGLMLDDEDVGSCDGLDGGVQTTCASFSLFFDGSLAGIDADDIDGISLP